VKRAGGEGRDLLDTRQLAGVEEIARAFEAGASLRLVLVRRGSDDPAIDELVARVREAGVPVQATSENDLRRMSRTRAPAEVLALLGPDPKAEPEAVLAARGAAWLLVGIRYPGNAGFAIRTAEVSGADGVFLDVDFDGPARKQALRASMYADRFMPVHWTSCEALIERAKAAERRVLAVEDVGECAPWEVNLTGAVLFLIGGEQRGIPQPALERCDAVIRIPMAGFIPSYNLQAAMAAVVGERLRQQALRAAPKPHGNRAALE
jgi:tRNA G18 (ribose-2'-O)-methylase SpoU